MKQIFQPPTLHFWIIYLNPLITYVDGSCCPAKKYRKIRKAEGTADAWCLRALWFRGEICWAQGQGAGMRTECPHGCLEPISEHVHHVRE